MLAARGQEPGRIYRLGCLLASPRDALHHVALFDELRRLGFIEGQNLVVDAAGYSLSPERMDVHAADLMNGRVDVILAAGDAAVRAARRATASIPILAFTDACSVKASCARSASRVGISRASPFLLNEMQRVYRLLREAREEGTIPWEWIVDETQLERVSTWADTDAYARTVARSYRRDFWNQQPVRCEVWSEKGTVRGVLAPVLDQYAIGFRVMHGFASATAVYDVAQNDDGRSLIVLYVGDYDPSGMFMSVHDLPDRLKKYDGGHVELRRIALKQEQTQDLLSFPASDKKGDKRYKWFVRNFGAQCWELDAMDPNDLRACIKREIKQLIEPVAWKRCEVVNKAEQESLRHVLDQWKGAKR